jgi:hypothetical protein
LAKLIALQGKVEQAVAMQKVIVEVSEKSFGIDNISTINAINTLAGYYYEIKSTEKTIDCLLKALYLSDLVGGEYVFIKLNFRTTNLFEFWTSSTSSTSSKATSKTASAVATKRRKESVGFSKKATASSSKTTKDWATCT